jgi:hypothetical protein
MTDETPTPTKIRVVPPALDPYPPPPETLSPPPKRSNRWEDWAVLVVSIWFFFSPWILQFGGNAPTPTAAAAIVADRAVSHAAWNAWVLGALVFIAAMSAIARMELWQERVNFALGAWIFAAPWALGFARGPFPRASWDHWIAGALVLILSFWNLLATRATIDTMPPTTLPPRRF